LEETARCVGEAGSQSVAIRGRYSDGSSDAAKKGGMDGVRKGKVVGCSASGHSCQSTLI